MKPLLQAAREATPYLLAELLFPAERSSRSRSGFTGIGAGSVMDAILVTLAAVLILAAADFWLMRDE